MDEDIQNKGDSTIHVRIAVVETLIEKTLDVAGEEVVGPEEVEVMDEYNGTRTM